MNRVKILAFLASAALIVVAPAPRGGVRGGRAYAEGPPGGYTHAPGERDCTVCHLGMGRNTGPGKFTITAPAAYQLGQTYSIVVANTTTDQSRRRWGFQLTALTTGKSQAGNLENVDANTQVVNGQGPGFDRQYIEHTQDGTFAGQTGGSHWTFNWTAPSMDVATVTFYAAGNQANDDGNSTGDQIYTTSVIARSPSFKPPVVLNASVVGKELMVLGQN
jgi:hypothetical protein